jgi:diguanylate cyclase (GGDEF)-like protein
MPEIRTDLAERLRSHQAALKRRLSRVDHLVHVIRTLHSSLDPERVGREIASHMADWLPFARWTVVAEEAGGGGLTLGLDRIETTMEGPARAVAALVMRTGRFFSTRDLSIDAQMVRAGTLPPAVAAFGFPLTCRGRTLGAVVGFDKAPALEDPRFPPGTLEILLTALEPAAVALDNALRVQKAEALSVTDDLTQLYNSRYLSQVMRRETKRASRSGRPLSLLFIDLDGFKAVNDTHGHLTGSRALVEAAGVIRVSARDTDLVARFGGDEFAVVLPDTGSDGASAVADRIRERVAGQAFLEDEGLNIALTVSVGVATLPDVSVSAEGLIHAADTAMYWVKARGRNGIHVAV